MPGDTSPLRDYQEHGIDWLQTGLQTYKAVMLADDMGLGKTLQALRAAERLGAQHVLIVCPAGARRVWQQEILTWVPGWADRTVLIEPPATPLSVMGHLRDPQLPLTLIVGYDEFSNLKTKVTQRLQHWGSLLGHRHWDLLILDEAHYLKNPSNRTHAIYGKAGTSEGLQAHADHVILLTGTPTPNHAGELWQHVRTFWSLLVPDRGRTQAGFEERFTRYRDTVFGRQIVGSKNQKILRDALCPVVLRRRKDDVLTELPPLVLQDVPLIWPKSPDVWVSQLRPETRAVASRLAFSSRHASDDEMLRLLRNPEGALASVRREMGVLKVAPTLLWVQERMLSVNKLLLFAWHHDVIEQLHHGLLDFDPVVVTGNSSPNARALAVEDFQTSPGTRIFIGQILAAGTAITLTAASEVAIVEPSWVPGENVQAIARAHRLGQRDSVLASFLYLPGTLDERIMGTFRRKAGEISVLLGDDNASAA